MISITTGSVYLSAVIMYTMLHRCVTMPQYYPRAQWKLLGVYKLNRSRCVELAVAYEAKSGIGRDKWIILFWHILAANWKCTTKLLSHSRYTGFEEQLHVQ